MEKGLWLLIIFIGLQIIAGAITIILNGFIWWDFLLVFVKSSFFAYGSWQNRQNVFWVCSIISCLLTIVYFVMYAGYVNAIAEAISILIIIIVMIKTYKYRKIEAKNENKLKMNKKIG